MNEPQWFFSSLAQVTAAIVGFLGGFLLLRLLEMMREWRTIEQRLRERQKVWSRAHWINEQMRDEDHKLGPFTGERLQVSRNETHAWGDLYETIKEWQAIAIPREVKYALGGLMILALGGTLGPLLALRAPSLFTRTIWLGLWAVVFIALSLSIWVVLVRTEQEVKAFKLYDHTEGKLEDYELWVQELDYRMEQRSDEQEESDES